MLLIFESLMNLCPSIVIFYFVELMFLMYILIKRLANILAPHKSSVLEMILFTKLTVHPSSFIFVDTVAYCKLCLSLEIFIYIYLKLGDNINIGVVSRIFILV